MTNTEHRIDAFERALVERLSTRTRSTRFGIAYFHDDFPGRYDSNFVLVDAPLSGVGPEALTAEIDRVQAGLAHRHIYVTDAEEGSRLLPGLVGLGYRGERLVTMVQARDPDLLSDDLAEEAEADELGPFLLRVNREADGGVNAADAEMLAAFRHVLADHADARFFVIRSDGEIAAIAELYPLDDVAQVEAVYTLESHRGRGFGRAVVLAASKAARGAGADLVFLNADDEDWPKELYGKLGFDELRRFWSFVKSPD